MAMNEYQSASVSSRSGVSEVETTRSSMVQTVSLNVAGMSITIRTDQNVEYLKGLALEVNRIVNALRQSSPYSGIPQLMALALIQLADRTCEAETALEQSNRKVEMHIERLSKILNTLDKGDY